MTQIWLEEDAQPLTDEFADEIAIDDWYAHNSGCLETDLDDYDEEASVFQSIEFPEGWPPGEGVDLLNYVKSQVPGWRPQRQVRGTCVGQGHKLAVDVVMAVNHRINGTQWVGRAAVAPIYAGSRVDIANKPGRWDGSYGWAACKWIRDYGVVTLQEMGLPDDSQQEDERIAVNWTTKRNGVPREFEDLAKEKPIEMYTKVRTAREAAWLLYWGHPCQTCSNWLPTGRTSRDGVSSYRNSGGHCMAMLAYRKRDGRYEFTDDNSWGSSWGDNGRVWKTEKDCQKQLNRGDSFAIVGQTGLEPIEDTFAL